MNALPFPLSSAPVAVSPEGQNQQIDLVVHRERRRLLDFIRRRIPDPLDAEDVLQDVFYELVQSYRLVRPIEQMAAWLFRVARNKITDRYRRPKVIESLDALTAAPYDSDGEPLLLAELMPAADATDGDLLREALLEALAAGLEELPADQRAVFVAHEIDGKSFNQLVEETGLPLNTLLARKHYAVKKLRTKLRALYDEYFID
ncbi:MAG: sigma-70 family RNA polymerase sigma factor [Hymenobacteraceae bacterium]|nr:sigma-70 family RNA polymerase sigma factor [Hymenobacteraceae bacterium]